MRGNHRGCEIGYNTVAMSHPLRAVRESRQLTPMGALTAALFVAYFVALAPHLVHHIVAEGHSRPACPHLVQSQQAPAVQVDPPTLVPPEPVETLKAVLPEAVALPSPDAPYPPRAPPHALTSAWS